MNVSVVELSPNQKKLLVEIPAEQVAKQIEAKYRDLGKTVRIKGFRPGKVPLSILKSYYGKAVESEVSSQFIQDTFPDALREMDVKPLVEADVSEMSFEDNGTFTYAAIVDVCPPFEVTAYRGLSLRRPTVQIDAEQEEQELERIRQQHAQLRTIENERAVHDGDVVLIDFTPTVDGTVFRKGQVNDYMLEVGKKAIHPDLDAHFLGRRSGDIFNVELDYPEDAPTKEIAGKRVLVHLVIKEVKEKIVPELNDDFASEVGRFDSLDALRQTIREQIAKREESRTTSEVRRQIAEQLVEGTSFDLSPKVVEREVDRLIGLLQHQFESQGLKIDTSRFNSPEIRADYRAQAEKNVRWRLICRQIAEQESLQLSDDEVEEIYQEVARFTRKDIDTVRSEYADSNIVEQSKDDRILDRVFKLIEAEAVYTESAAEPITSSQE
jgi:trigger factor